MREMNLFLNSNHDLRSGWKFLIFAAVLVGSFYATGIFVLLIYLRTTIPGGEFTELVLNYIVKFVAALVAMLFMAGFVDKVPLATYGVAFHEGWKRDLAMGVGIAAGLFL